MLQYADMINIMIPRQISGELVAIPKKEYQLFNSFLEFIDIKQIFFWTKEWQAKERQADKDITTGKVSKTYDSTKNLKKALNLLKK
ncbi:hypothetical protein A3B85_03005 [Candidatus Nomurabacteria bacterium RIFCSPHIGHO2_02_FULL_37_13]|uniref:Uncharacterized protein n=1 Tax=Candidatus Nomurabacteria bacterium RIFCSPHIGHO2_02_FULL_37_13 TaxID=1801750 RepID=A0A1F6W684_9BACT|nr:MAG: hypothetical protein A2640_01470 [Candidatus Nomurabacteria bacterium RIFCSPHIGHO2_01_FULL_36_23]OGI77195.1 MAG: hypothetical protein A3B85_03005 [Candidatus Nomurabacteria bacterium RIFCSPHIGHO2_02_FULL_37_13]OGI87735.1 MAG: hypothetical protein A2906_02740 [Candidatus Nomurabacteria bacterium RIFCSPLOWO2_01_FULL_37_25]